MDQTPQPNTHFLSDYCAAASCLRSAAPIAGCRGKRYVGAVCGVALLGGELEVELSTTG